MHKKLIFSFENIKKKLMVKRLTQNVLKIYFTELRKNIPDFIFDLKFIFYALFELSRAFFPSKF